MYNCDICGVTSQPKQPRLHRCVYYDNGNIHKEVQMCLDCYRLSSPTDKVEKIVHNSPTRCMRRDIINPVKKHRRK